MEIFDDPIMHHCKFPCTVAVWVCIFVYRCTVSSQTDMADSDLRMVDIFHFLLQACNLIRLFIWYPPLQLVKQAIFESRTQEEGLRL